MAFKYCNIRAKVLVVTEGLCHQIILDYCPPYAQNEIILLGKTTGPKLSLI